MASSLQQVIASSLRCGGDRDSDADASDARLTHAPMALARFARSLTEPKPPSRSETSIAISEPASVAASSPSAPSEETSLEAYCSRMAE